MCWVTAVWFSEKCIRAASHTKEQLGSVLSDVLVEDEQMLGDLVAADLREMPSARGLFDEGVCKHTKVGFAWSPLGGLCVGEGMFWWAPIGH